MTETRTRERCGAAFVPRRGHAPFCCVAFLNLAAASAPAITRGGAHAGR
jgi:hypothetical protein